MRGNRDKTIFGKINGTFIYLVDAAIRHCLREYQLGNRLKNNLIKFKYKTAAIKYRMGREMVKV